MFVSEFSLYSSWFKPWSSVHLLISSSHGLIRSPFIKSVLSFNCFINSMSEFFTCPKTAIFASIIFETDDWSTSKCMIFAFGAKRSGVFVILSSNLAPIAIIKSALCIAIFDW